MKKISKKAYAKVNLGLKVSNKKEDGYHNLETIIIPISLHDKICITKINKRTIDLNCNVKELENDSNLVIKAAKLINDMYNLDSGIKIDLIKNIPTEAGLGGGSADCAATLTLLNELFDLKIETSKLIDLALTLGADVPACIINNTKFVQGIGEKLTDIDSKMKFYILIIKPNISFSTRTMYAKIDLINENIFIKRSDFNRAIKCMKSLDIDDFVKYIYNDFEYVVDNIVIDELKKELLSTGAIKSLMTGSGSAVYGIFKSDNEMKAAYKILKSKYRVYMCESINEEN